MTDSAERLSIIVPVFNEARTIRAVIDRLLAINLPLAREIIVVDDGSSDGTAEALRDPMPEGAPVSVITCAQNAGKGSAIRTGLAHARGTILAIQDADLELDPAQLASLVTPILEGTADVVYGSRFLRGRPAAPWLTVVANRVLTALTNLLYGSSLTDMETCYKVMRVEVARSLRLTANRFDIEPEITAKLLRAGHRIHERSVRFEPRSIAQGKKIKWRDGIHAIAALARRAPRARLAAGAAAIGAALLAAGTLAIGLGEGTYAVGGSDASCYALQADRWAAGRLIVPEPLARDAPWPNAHASFTPLGHVPSNVVSGAFVPICPAGLSLAMAAFQRVGGSSAIFLVVPLFGALFVWGGFLIGRRWGPAVGLATAVVSACSPAFLFQLVQPMSDVPAAALWVIAVAVALDATRARGGLAAGLATSAAIVIRPNLAPLAIPIAGLLATRSGASRGQRMRAAGAFLAACAPGCLAVAAINQVLYGSPLASGYGSLATLFSMDHVPANAARYGGWFLSTHSPLMLLALVAPLVVPGPVPALMLAFVAINAALYLPYVVFQPHEWQYLRFFLPSIPLVAALAFAALDAIARRWSLRMAAWTTTAAAVALALFLVDVAADRHAFRLDNLDARYWRAGRYVADRLPSNALVVTTAHSGNVRFYAGRPTLSWYELTPEWLEPALAFVRERGYEPYLLLESGEEPEFRDRFRGTALGPLDWPPAAEIAGGVRVYRPDDRARFLDGAEVRTEYVR